MEQTPETNLVHRYEESETVKLGMKRSNRSCRFHRDGQQVGGRASPIARASQALSSSFAAAFPGRCSRRNSGAGRG